jgi:hypothetical protein
MLRDCGLEVDECYTATWRESKYTLFHLQRKDRLRRSGMDKIMQQIHYSFNIVTTEIFGFDSVSSNSKSDGELVDHPGFRIMIEKVNKEPLDLEWWMGCGATDLCENRKGLLWKHIESTDAKKMTNAQLVDRVQKWAPVVKESEELKKVNGMLGEQNAALIDRVRELEEEVRAERAFSHDLLMKHVSSVTERHDRAFGRGNAAD